MLIWAASFMLPAFPAAAQQMRTITVDEALRLALERSPALEQAENTLAASQSAAQAEKLWFLPSLSLSLYPTQRYGLVFDQTAGRLVQRKSSFMSMGLSAGVTLFNGFEHQASLRQARAQERRYRQERRRRQQTVVFNVLAGYLAVIQGQEQLRIQQQALQDEERLLARTKELTAAGIQPVTNLYQQQAAVAGRKLAIISAKRSLKNAKAELIAAVGLDPTGAYSFKAPPIDTNAVREDYSLETLIQRAQERRADVQAQRAQVEVARAAAEVARAALWPTLRLSGSVGTSYTSIQRIPLGRQFSDNRSGAIGLSLSIPLFNRMETRDRITQAEVTYRNARLQLEALKRTAAKEVRQAYHNYQLAVESLPVTQTQLEAAEKALQSARRRYELGTATFIELTNARETYVQAQSQRVQAIYNAVFQRKILDYYAGGLAVGDLLFR